MAIVFQYGSNCSKHRLNSPDRLNGAAAWIGQALTVEIYEIDFSVFSETNECAAADIVPGSGRRIWGVLYDIPDYLIKRETAGTRKSLDAIEAEGKNYRRTAIDVEQPDGTVRTAITYVVKTRASGLKTSLSYVEHIIRGLRDANVPNDYVEYVKQRVVENSPGLKKSLALL